MLLVMMIPVDFMSIVVSDKDKQVELQFSDLVVVDEDDDFLFFLVVLT